MVNSNKLGEKFSENELMYGLSKIADQKNLEYIYSDIYLSLKSKGLVYEVGNKELLTEKGKETLNNLKKSLNDVWIEHGYNIANYEELLVVTNDVQKIVRYIMSSLDSEVNLDTLIDELIFHNVKITNSSIILGLKQDYNIQTVRDLLNINFGLSSIFQYKSLKYIRREISRLKKKLL